MKTARPSRKILPLDGQEGPALPLPAVAVDRMARSIAQRAASADSAARAGRRQGRLTNLRWRIGVGIAIATGSAAALHWIPSRGTQPEIQDSQPTPPVLSTPVPNPRLVAKRSPVVPPEAGAVKPPPSARLVESAPSPSVGHTRTTSAKPSSVPAGLLGRANERRRAQQWAAATALYERIIREYPSSAEAYSARVAAASLHLEKLDDPVTARRLFDQALQSPRSRALDEETLWGLARANRAEGNPRAEQAALKRLLAEHPETLHAPYARARLRQLGAEAR